MTAEGAIMILLNTALKPTAAAREFFDEGYRQISRRHMLLARVDIHDVADFYIELGYDMLSDLPKEQLDNHYRRCNSPDKIQLPDGDFRSWSSDVMKELRTIQLTEQDREQAIAQDPTPATIEELRQHNDVERLARVAYAQLSRAQSAEAHLLNINPSKSLYKILIDDIWANWDDNQIEIDGIEDALGNIDIVVTTVESIFTAESQVPVPVTKVIEAIARVTSRKVTVERYDLLDKAFSEED